MTRLYGPRLMLRTLDCHVMQVRPQGGFGNRSCVRRIVLLSFDKRLHVDGRDETHLVTQALREPPPEVARGTCFHCHNAGRLIAQNRLELRARDYPVEQNRPSRRGRTNLKTTLCEIDRENVDVGHLLLLLQRNVAPVWHHTMPGEGGIHPISSVGGKQRLHLTERKASFAVGTWNLEWRLSRSVHGAEMHRRLMAVDPGTR